MPIQAEGLTLDEPSSGRFRFRGEVPGPARITSPHDPSLSFEVEVVDPTTVTVAWKPDAASIQASYGGTRLQPTAMTKGRNLCGLPGGTWSATGQNPVFSVRGRAVGTCTVEVRDESARWVTEVHLDVG